ncbi:MAG TPA: FG-GAP repeat protein, partial [Propionibacteriaceae bacterium]|nr:FG-GAP repeat protein [Propionibacteriaceae bacterium]
MRRIVVMLLATALLVVWPLAAAQTSQPAANAEPTVQEDFNGDSIPDLAIAAPDETLGGAEAAGVVHVLYGGTSAGLTATGSQLWSQETPGVAGTPEGLDRFGAALASGDYNGDGRADLAIGAPGENASSGVVHVLYGSAAGLTATGSQLWSQDSPGIGGTAEANDQFGDALAAGDFAGDGRTDLAVGAFGENDFAGVVNVLYGSAAGLTATGSQLWSQDSPGVAGTAEGGDQFGFALAAADPNGDFRGELAVGAPGENDNAGVVHVLIGSPAGLTATGSQLWSQDSPGVAGAAEFDDRFGNALTSGDFSGDSRGDLAVGAPGENTFSGVIHVLYGSAAGLTATGSQLWSQASPGVAGEPEGADFFGLALAAGDFNGDARAELAVGAPGENVNTGVVHVLLGSAGGVTATGSQLWSQDSPGVAGTAEQGDFFGDVLAAGTLTSEGGAAATSRTPSRQTEPFTGRSPVRGSLGLRETERSARKPHKQ